MQTENLLQPEAVYTAIYCGAGRDTPIGTVVTTYDGEAELWRVQYSGRYGNIPLIEIEAEQLAYYMFEACGDVPDEELPSEVEYLRAESLEELARALGNQPWLKLEPVAEGEAPKPIDVKHCPRNIAIGWQGDNEY